VSRYLLLVGTLLALFLLLFGVTKALPVPVLTDPAVTLGAADVSAAVLGIGLLVTDVVLPVPSSLVMITHGALFGPVLGAGLSLVGAVGATLTGYGLGHWGGRPLVGRICSKQDRRRAEALVRRWGLLVMTASRPVPLLAETIAVVAGTSSLGLVRTAVAALLGALPGALLYGAAGATALDKPSELAVCATVLAITAALWLTGRHWARPATEDPAPIR
jgi:uncharacterized membrane protein YdjX (TVP38/TMEM64 family)